MLYYSASQSGFFDDAIHATIPGDAVEISRQTHAELMTGQANGLRITADANSYPVLASPPKPSAPTEAELKAACEAQAKRLISESDWAMLPDVPLTNRAAFEAYRSMLRGLILNPVTEPNWPTLPDPEW